MTKFLLSILLICGATVASAEEDHAERHALFDDTYLTSGYTSFGARSAAAGGAHGLYLSVEGGWHFDQLATFGIRGESLATTTHVGPTTAGALSIYLFDGFAEASLFNEGLFEVTTTGILGWGEAGYHDRPDPNAASQWQRTSLVLGEADVNGMLHLTHRVDLVLSAGYRAVRGSQLVGLSDKGLSGPTAAFSVRGNF